MLNNRYEAFGFVDVPRDHPGQPLTDEQIADRAPPLIRSRMARWAKDGTLLEFTIRQHDSTDTEAQEQLAEQHRQQVAALPRIAPRLDRVIDQIGFLPLSGREARRLVEYPFSTAKQASRDIATVLAAGLESFWQADRPVMLVAYRAKPSDTAKQPRLQRAIVPTGDLAEAQAIIAAQIDLQGAVELIAAGRAIDIDTDAQPAPAQRTRAPRQATEQRQTAPRPTEARPAPANSTDAPAQPTTIEPAKLVPRRDLSPVAIRLLDRVAKLAERVAVSDHDAERWAAMRHRLERTA